MTAPSTSSTNDVHTANPAYEVSTVNSNINTVCPQVSTANFSDNAVYAFMVENPNGSNLLQQDLEQIQEDDLKAMDLKWQLSLLSSDKLALMAFSNSSSYKRGLATVEEQLITYRKNEVLFSEEVAVLKREVACKDYEINVLKIVRSQITKKNKKGLGYNVVPPPHPLIYNRPKKLDLSYSGLDEFKDPEFKSYGSEDSKQESNIVCDKKSDDSKENSDDSLVKEQVSEDASSFVESLLNVDKETIFLVDKKIEFSKSKNHEKPVKSQLGNDFVMYNKACFVCGSFDHIQARCKYHQRERMVYGNNYNRVNYNYTVTPSNLSMQRNVEYPRRYIIGSIAQDLRTTTKRVV
ncbi:hypothetical protein Tco_0077889 [Tanacetum coccineum]